LTVLSLRDSQCEEPQKHGAIRTIVSRSRQKFFRGVRFADDWPEDGATPPAILNIEHVIAAVKEVTRNSFRTTPTVPANPSKTIAL
jgi:hypothetical protein